jgi:TPR repeat protein
MLRSEPVPDNNHDYFSGVHPTRSANCHAGSWRLLIWWYSIVLNPNVPIEETSLFRISSGGKWKMTLSDREHEAYTAASEKRYIDAEELLLPLAKEGSLYAMELLGWLHRGALIPSANNRDAILCYQAAARNGAADANFWLGILLLDENDKIGARSAFEHAATKNHIRAMYELGALLLRHPDGSEEHSQGLEWIGRAAKSGNLYAKRKLLSREIKENGASLTSIKAILKIPFLALKAGYLAYKSPDNELL